MWRFLAGMASTLLLAGAGLLYWQGSDNRVGALPAAPSDDSDEPALLADLPDPASANPKSKEEKRFLRFDRDKNGAVSKDEYLLSRQKAYARLDANGDGVLQFSEYATKTAQKFGKADADKSGSLNHKEFAATRVVRKVRRKPVCPPSFGPPQRPMPVQEEGGDEA
jgi:hypothetical protein